MEKTRRITGLFSKKKRLAGIITILFLLTILVAGAPYLWWELNFFLTPVTPGRFYRSKAMPPDRLVDISRKRGIRTVIDLRNAGRKKAEEKTNLLRSMEAEEEELTSIGVSYHNIPAQQSKNNEVAIQTYLNILDNTNSWPVLIHCKDGAGRSGVFTALYLMEYQGKNNREALEHVAEWRTYRLQGRKNFRPGKGKADFILKYTPRDSAS